MSEKNAVIDIQKYLDNDDVVEVKLQIVSIFRDVNGKTFDDNKVTTNIILKEKKNDNGVIITPDKPGIYGSGNIQVF
ncbi:hypothetical protein C0583_02580 [Candidatus Parcubacteria bacterium]|nr:MAG: hypothetical protein C0583_02580 [Candidatus Parcubacteria bacterium]